MVKEGFNFWEEDSGLHKSSNPQVLENFYAEMSDMSTEIIASELSDDSRQVAVTIAGYVYAARQVQKKIQCSACSNKLKKSRYIAQ